MDAVANGECLPATERALVGLCHGLNDQLAALNAYVFLLERRGVLDESDAPLRKHLDKLAQQVRLVRSLARDHEPDVSPVSLTLLTESATEIMDGFPEGSIVFDALRADDGPVVRADWNRVLRALLVAGEWASRGEREDRRVSVEAESKHSLLVTAEPTGVPSPEEPHFDEGDLRVESVSPRSARIVLPGAG